MNREFTYTKQKLRFILSHVLEHDVRGAAVYATEERAEEGFEKRAVLEFLLWFLEQGFPDNGEFPYCYEDLEADYPPDLARRIADGKGWSARHVDGPNGPDNVVVVDFTRKR